MSLTATSGFRVSSNLVKQNRTEIMIKKAKSENNPPLQKLAYTTNEAAQMLGVNPATVWRLTKRGLLRPSKGIRYARYTLDELQRYLRETASEPAKA